MMTTATTNIRISCGRMPIPAMRMTSSPTGDGTTICDGPQTASPRLVRMMPKPMVLMTQDMPGLPANGRTARIVEHHAEQPNHDHCHDSGKQLLPAPTASRPTSGALIGLPSSSHRTVTPMKAPTDTKSP